MQAAALLARSALLAIMTNIPPPLLGVELPAVVVALDPGDIEKASVDNLINALPAPIIDKIWVKVRQPISIEELSIYLKLDETLLARLNNVNEDHHFRQGDWLVVPSLQTRQIKQLAAIDTNAMRRTPPLQSLPPTEERAVVRFGDTVAKIAQRYGLTLQELLRLNPGLETARLVVGMQVRLAETTSDRTRIEPGLNPNTSSTQGWIWPTTGVFISDYGWREGKMHYGIDVANKVGTPIVAAKSGRVVFSGWRDANYGYVVTLSHSDGSLSLYAHNSRLMVQTGEYVEQGSLISLMGSSGRSKDSSLHFEIHPPGSAAADPLLFLPGKTQPLDPDPAPLSSSPSNRFDASLDELVRNGVVAPGKRARIRSGSGMDPSVSAHQRACDSGVLSYRECSSDLAVRLRGLQTTVSGPIIKPLSLNEQALLKRIRSKSHTPQWRTYGQCKYDWAGWRQNSNGTRTTAADCGGSAIRWTVGVSCDRLLVATYTTGSGWSKWRAPAGPENKSKQGEDEMVAALCANV